MKNIILIIIGFLLIIFFPIVEGFEDCIVDTLADLKNDVAELKTEMDEIKGKKSEATDSVDPVLADQSEETYNDLNDNISVALTTFQ
jgi:hypothetical protein